MRFAVELRDIQAFINPVVLLLIIGGMIDKNRRHR